ncbi:hypothetical protein [Shimia sagamensis]|uniref:hypothetical protein n=1 Tax=Shimia sagamensis TaxID=1566352 RepID=UPI0024B694D3|nr:hypothetical protein [Shimia sagamensis]
MFKTTMKAVALTALLACNSAVVMAQSDELFDDIILDNEFELEAEDDTSPSDLISLAPLQVTFSSSLVADNYPDLNDADFIRPYEVQSGARIPQGAELRIWIELERPKHIKWKRRTRLYSAQNNAKNSLSEDVLLELDGTDNLYLKWKGTSYEDWPKVAYLKAPVNFDSYTTETGRRNTSGHFQLPTAHLLPGDYHILLGIFRREDGEDVEEDLQRFAFSVIDAPLSVTTEVPGSIPAYVDKQSAHQTRFAAYMSDWAVPPINAHLMSELPGMTITNEGTSTWNLGDPLFSLTLEPPVDVAGLRDTMVLEVTDGLGRTAIWEKTVKITDGLSSQMQVEMVRKVDAGDMLYGTVTYPSGFEMSEPPFVGDKRGFEWTNDDYTAFRIRVKEEGVHHQRLLGLVVRGQVAGVNEFATLVWQQRYKVLSQDLIYDPEAIAAAKVERAATAARRASVFVEVMTDVGASYEQIEDYQAESFFEVISIEEGDSGEGDDSWGQTTDVFEAVEGDSSLTYDRTTGGSNTADLSPPQNGSSNAYEAGIEGEICGVPVLGDEFEVGYQKNDYVSEGVGNVTYTEDNVEYDIIRLVKYGLPYDGYETYDKLEFIKDSCVLIAEETANRVGGDDYALYYSNGGRRSLLSEFTKKTWDRRGNLTSHSKRKGYHADWENVCSNFGYLRKKSPCSTP